MGIGISFSFTQDGHINLNYNDNKKKAKRNKGKSLIDFPVDFCVIDIETTGLDSKFDDIIEISALKVRNSNIIDIYSTLIKPNSYYILGNSETENEDYIIKDGEKIYYIDSFITELTGITNKMLEDAPNFDNIKTEFLQFISNDILVGHNVNFDINFIYDKLENYNINFNNDFIDTLRLSRKLLPELTNHKLKTLADYFNLDTTTLHRAENDCFATLSCFNSLHNIAIDKYETIENFCNYTRQNHNLSESEIIKNTVAKNNSFDENHPFFQKEFVFTGKLEKMLRKDAIQIVVNLGGKCNSNVTKNTNYLVLGNNDYCRLIKDGKSSKQKKYEELKRKGYDIELLSENVFYDLIEEQ